MYSLSNFSFNWLAAIITSVIISLSLYACHRLLLSNKKHWTNWRDYWLFLNILSFLPLLYCLIPSQYFVFSTFDINQLHLIDVETTTKINPSLIKNDNNTSPYFSAINSSIVLVSFLILMLSIVNIIKLIWQWKRVITMIEKSTAISDCYDWLDPYLMHKLQQLQSLKIVEIKVTDQVTSPFAYQLIKSYVILPKHLLIHLNKQQIDLIMSHELNHLKKRDPRWILFVQLLSSFAWFNPWLRIFNQQMYQAIEISCDNQVLSRQPHLRRIYAQLMLIILRESATKTTNHSVAAFSINTQKSITMRINNIMKASEQDVKFKYRKALLYSHAALLAGITFFIQPQVLATESDKLNLLNPVKEAYISSPYGAKNQFHQFHKGIDLAAKTDTPIIAVTDGKVRVSTDLLKNKKNYGKIIIIDHADGMHSVYSHLNSRIVKEGDQVKAGELIGYVGSTGRSTGPHLHLELLKDNKHVNPSDYINFN